MPPLEAQPTRLPTATGALARLAAREAVGAGVDLAPLLRTAALTAADIEDSDRRLPADRQIVFINAVAEVLRRERLGFELGRTFDLRTIGLLYYVASSS